MATHYVDGAVGDNGNAGTSEGAGNAWATIDYADTNSSAGDTIYIKASADYTETASLTAGSYSNWKTFIGYTSTPGDGGKATIDATGLTNGITGPAFGSSYIRIENIIVKNATNTGCYHYATDMLMYINCEANNNGSIGFDVSAQSSLVINCSASDNTSHGIRCQAQSVVAFCVCKDNGGGISSNTRSAVLFCEVTGNSGIGIYEPLVALNNTIDGDGKTTTTGIQIEGDTRPEVVMNNIIYDCTTGVLGNSSASKGMTVFKNLLYSNTTNFSKIYDEHDNITGSAPGFTDEAGGDYTLAAGSAARNEGADSGEAGGTSSPGMDIGAHQSADAGGGGSRVIITG